MAAPPRGASPAEAYERGRLDGALLAARTLAHHAGNHLALTVGYLELLLDDPRLPAALRADLAEALRGAEAAAALAHRLAGLRRVAGAPAPPGLPPLLDLDRSTAP